MRGLRLDLPGALHPWRIHYFLLSSLLSSFLPVPTHLVRGVGLLDAPPLLVAPLLLLAALLGGGADLRAGGRGRWGGAQGQATLPLRQQRPAYVYLGCYLLAG